MNEENTKKLIQNSLLKTSEGFTQELFDKIQVRKNQIRSFQKALITVCVLSGLFLFALIKMPSDFSLFQLQIKLPSLLVKMVGSLFVFILINKLLSMKSEFS
jgi:hypothetical protein